eukprot:Pgem_evm1s14181
MGINKQKMKNKINKGIIVATRSDGSPIYHHDMNFIENSAFDIEYVEENVE